MNGVTSAMFYIERVQNFEKVVNINKGGPADAWEMGSSRYPFDFKVSATFLKR